MTMVERLEEAIVQERERRKVFSAANLLPLLRRGEVQEAVESLIFFTSPADFPPRLETIRREIRDEFNQVGQGRQKCYLRFLADLTLGLRSFLPRWNLQNADNADEYIRYGDATLTDAQVEAAAGQVHALAAELAARTPPAAERLLAGWRAETVSRLKVERAPDPQGEAQVLMGHSVGEYLDNVSAELAGSNLRRIAGMQVPGRPRTEISNDYAAFLQHVMYSGASFVTCNPPLVDAAWVAAPERWNPIVDGIIANHPAADDDFLARQVTLEIVLANMRLLRPIFLLTGGKMGCVSLQVNPKKHGDAETMISDALSIYEELRKRLRGGVPNVVFKLPGTQAGLEACRALTRRGRGVTITINFGLFQHLPFARAIHQGQAIFSCLAHMSGRLAYPVRDEMLVKLDELAAYGISEAQARQAAAWSGVAVLKRLYSVLAARGYDLTRIKPLIASLRVYAGNGYENLPSAFPDITEAIGTSIITVFPDVRRTFDGQPQLDLAPSRIAAPVPDDVLETLTHSEIFKQAYYVAERDWVTEEDERFRPDHELTLEDEEGVAAWPPVRNTLAEFSNSYDTFVQRILERKRLLTGVK